MRSLPARKNRDTSHIFYQSGDGKNRDTSHIFYQSRAPKGSDLEYCITLGKNRDTSHIFYQSEENQGHLPYFIMALSTGTEGVCGVCQREKIGTLPIYSTNPAITVPPPVPPCTVPLASQLTQQEISLLRMGAIIASVKLVHPRLLAKLVWE